MPAGWSAGHLLATFGGFMSSPFAAIASQPMASNLEGSVSAPAADADRKSAGELLSFLMDTVVACPG